MLHVCSHSMLPAVLKSEFIIKVKVTKSIQSQCTLLSILCFNHSLHQLGVAYLSQNILSGVNCDYYFCCFIFSLISNFKILINIKWSCSTIWMILICFCSIALIVCSQGLNQSLVCCCVLSALYQICYFQSTRWKWNLHTNCVVLNPVPMKGK